MDTIDSLTRKGYRVYKLDMKVKPTLKHYLKVRYGLQVEYHEELKVITVRDAKGESSI